MASTCAAILSYSDRLPFSYFHLQPFSPLKFKRKAVKTSPISVHSLGGEQQFPQSKHLLPCLLYSTSTSTFPVDSFREIFVGFYTVFGGCLGLPSWNTQDSLNFINNRFMSWMFAGQHTNSCHAIFPTATQMVWCSCVFSASETARVYHWPPLIWSRTTQKWRTGFTPYIARLHFIQATTTTSRSLWTEFRLQPDGRITFCFYQPVRSS